MVNKDVICLWIFFVFAGHRGQKALVHSSNCVREKDEWISFNRNDFVSFEVEDNIATNVKKLAGNITPDAITSPNADTPGGKVSE